ncbi:hypothetical protein [Rufibacter tibetensis]|nr:hypothetical protein [Rufibacter tibetensis]
MKSTTQPSNFTYQAFMIGKIKEGFNNEVFERGDAPNEVAMLALQARSLVAQLEASEPTLSQPLQEVAWQVDNLLHEAQAITSAPKRDLYGYLKAFYDTKLSILGLLQHFERHLDY